MRVAAESIAFDIEGKGHVHQFSKLRNRLSGTFWKTAGMVLVTGACYYLATRAGWALCFPNSNVSLIPPQHAVLVSVLLLVPTRHWLEYTLAALGAHFVATLQADWPLLYSLQCGIFDVVRNVAVAAGIRIFIKSPIQAFTLRDAIAFVLIAVVAIPFGTAFLGAAFTLPNQYGTHYWVEWRNLGISIGVTTIILVPAIVHGLSLLSISRPPRHLVEAGALGVGVLTVGYLVFDRLPAGPDVSPVLLYAPMPLLIWAALRFGPGGMSLSMLAISFQVIWGATHGRGPFLMQSPVENALALQSFILAISVPLYLLSVVAGQQKLSEQALRDSEGRYREVVESHTNLLCRHLADSTLTFVNDAYCQFLGRRREELLGRKFLDFIPARSRAAVSSRLAGLSLDRGGLTQEIELTLPDKKTVWCQWTDYPVKGTRGHAAEFQAVGHDISDRKRAEEAMRILAHATRVSTVGAMAGSLAHELNQPLTAILSNAQAGSRFMADPAPDFAEVREVLEDIAKDTKRASEVIRQLRTLVRNEELRFDELELHHVVEDVIRLLHSDAVIRKVRVVLDFDNASHIVRGDGVQLQQVMLNLMLNAFDAMEDVPEGERSVRVRTRPTNARTVQVEVSDCGKGIHPEKLVKIFEPFQTTKQEGLGLGLSISRSIVEAHSGRLWAVNNPDRGATFCFRLPLSSVPLRPESRLGNRQGWEPAGASLS